MASICDDCVRCSDSCVALNIIKRIADDYLLVVELKGCKEYVKRGI